VLHVHLHVIPRFKSDGFGLRHPLGAAVAREALKVLEDEGLAAGGRLCRAPVQDHEAEGKWWIGL
jgi:diadenosine tetraphosphate (Ap4A) HIT family hydrolase